MEGGDFVPHLASLARSEWKYMLPFDLDLVNSGFVDGNGQRHGL